MRQEYHAVQHTLNWYCLDYWSERLGLDICAMTSEQGPRATLREDTVPFLDALKACGKRRILLTNAHPHNLAVKLKHTGWTRTLIYYFPPTHLVIRKRISVCGAPWRKKLALRRTKRCLSTTARRFWMPRGFGIRYCLGVTNPDSGLAEKAVSAPSGAE
jgi:putative hydrolase of the HAD superfamily